LGSTDADRRPGTIVRSLADQVVLVVGAGSGIGRKTALEAGRAGAGLALIGRHEGPLREVATEIEALDGGDAAPLVVVADVSSPELADKAVREVAGRLGRLDTVVYAAGINDKERALEAISVETWQSILSTNLNGAFYITRASVPVMRRQGGGLIVYIASAAVKRPDMSGIAYQASKGGMASLAHAAMEEGRAFGLRTTVIFPTLTDTPFVRYRPAPVDPAIMERALQPEDVAAACLFVMSLPPRAHVPELLLYSSNP
jgi:NAD(P)-dependent dehydrogenase (short-subunit alcohol dehydrogenase family)